MNLHELDDGDRLAIVNGMRAAADSYRDAAKTARREDPEGTAQLCANYETAARHADRLAARLAVAAPGLVVAFGRDAARLIEAQGEAAATLRTALRHARDAMPAEERAAFDAREYGRPFPEWMIAARAALASITEGQP